MTSDRFILVYFDVDGTILYNDLPPADWDDPQGRHPTTGEDIYGEMPIYNSHAYLNPELRPGDMQHIRHILTCRPRVRREYTLNVLRKHGIVTCTDFFYSGQYTRDSGLKWKANQLWWHLADYYVDNDPAYRRDLTEWLEWEGSDCQCISVAEWQRLLDAGVFTWRS